MKTLCLYYTRTNTTKEAMEHLAKLLDADIARYTDGKDRSGALGYLGACFASMKKKITIEGNISLSNYDRVLIGMPIWVEGPCAVGKALLNQYKDSLPKEVYYVVTQMGPSDYSSRIKKLDDLLGHPAAGQVSLKTKNNDFLKDAEVFAKTLKAD